MWMSLGSLMSGSLNERCLCTTGRGLLQGIDSGGSLTLPLHFFVLLLRGGRCGVSFLSFVNRVGIEVECDCSWPMSVVTFPSQ